MMNEWKTYKLGELVEINKNSINKNYSFEEIEYLDTSSVTENRFSELQKLKVSEAPSRAKRIVNENDIVYSTVRPILRHYGIAKNIKSNTIASTGFAVLTAKKIDPNFLYYYLTTDEVVYFLNSVAEANTTTFPAFNASLFENIEVTIPDLATQTQIAQILTSLDDKIELNLQMNQTLEAMAQALFKEWFVDFNFPTSSELGLKGLNDDRILDVKRKTENKEILQSSNPKNHNSDKLPKGWRMGKLNEVARIEIGRTPPRLEEEWFSKDEKDNKWISIRDMGQSGIYIFNTSEYLTNAAIEKFRIPVIPENTVILSFKLTIGRLAITTEKMLSNEAIAQINSSDFPPEYIYLYLKTYNWGSLGSTSSIATAVNSKTIKEMEILIPDTDISNLFKEVIRPIFEKIKYNSLQIQSLTQTRDTLLPKLMSGKITLSELGLVGLNDDRISDSNPILKSTNHKNHNSDK